MMSRRADVRVGAEVASFGEARRDRRVARQLSGVEVVQIQLLPTLR